MARANMCHWLKTSLISEDKNKECKYKLRYECLFMAEAHTGNTMGRENVGHWHWAEMPKEQMKTQT